MSECNFKSIMFLYLNTFQCIWPHVWCFKSRSDCLEKHCMGYQVPTHGHTRWYNPGCYQTCRVPRVRSTVCLHYNHSLTESDIIIKSILTCVIKGTFHIWNICQKYYITASIQTYISHYNKGKSPLMNTENESSARPITTALQAAEQATWNWKV